MRAFALFNLLQSHQLMTFSAIAKDFIRLGILNIYDMLIPAKDKAGIVVCVAETKRIREGEVVFQMNYFIADWIFLVN